jgi:hypothetical protein
VSDPLADASRRSAALGVATLTPVRIKRADLHGYRMFLSPRSITVATQRRRYYVIPSGMFQPFIADGSPDTLRTPSAVHVGGVGRCERCGLGLHRG